MQFFDATIAIVPIIAGAMISSLVVGLCLRSIYRNPEVRVIAHAILIILGAFGVFITIFAWSHILFDNPLVPIGGSLMILGLVILVALVIGFVTTSDMNTMK
ncbi:MAG: hypothetical protein ACFFFO_17895 [Candidatus Thorarchaeota archaeon]